MFTELLNRVRYVFRRSRFDAELDAELRFHLETRAAELQAEGIAPAAAFAQARREFGSTALAREDTRSSWQFRWLEDLASDLRYAARSFRRSAAFTFTAIVCLALGVGVNTVIFSIAMEVLFSRPSVRDPQSLAAIRVGGNSHAPMNVYRFLRDAHIFDGLAGEHEEEEINWRDGDVATRLSPIRVTDNFFAVTGMPVALGRPIEPGETLSVVLSYSLWQRRFNADPNVIGRKMILDGRVYNIAGVLPRDNRTLIGFGFSPDLYLPVSNESTNVALYARLPMGMTQVIAHARLEATCRQLDGPHPAARHQWARDISVTAVSGLQRIHADSNFASIAAFFAMLLIIVGLVLLIACANVASLLLARASGREHEIAIRLSIGAGRARLIRQLLAESLLLAICGTGAGLALNFVLTNLLSRIRMTVPVPLQYHIRPDGRLMAYSVALAIMSCLAAGLMPAIKSTRAGISTALKAEERQVSGRWTLRNVLVIGQLAVSIVLLCAGLLFVRNLVQASTSSPGFDTEHTVWASMRLVPESYASPQRTLALASAALEGLRALPGVDSVAIVRNVPLNSNMTMGLPVRTDLAPEPIPVTFRYNSVGPGYFHVMQIPILRGREFLPSDHRNAQHVAILNENMARRLFGRLDPIGHTITWQGEPELIVGIAKNSKYFTLGEKNMSAYYVPYEQGNVPHDNLDFVIRAAGRTDLLVAPADAVLGRIDSTAAIETKPMSQALVFALLPSRVGAAILGSVGLLGLALAAIGLYGVLLYSVSRRIREIGLRMALGATPRNVLLLVLRQSAALAASGIVIGLALAIFAVRPLAMFLIPEVHPTAPSTFAVVGAVLLAVALAATISPALRALRVDPIKALHYE
jgi:predicted permease